MGSFEIVSVGARMRPIVHLHQVLRAHVRVALGRAEAAVAEELLDESQIRAFAEHVGGEAVAKGVGSDAALDPRRARPALDDTMHPSGGEAAAAWIGEERPSPFAAHGQPRIERLEGNVARGYHPLLAPLAHDAHRALLPVQVVQIEAAAFGDAKPRSVEKLEERAVAQPRLRPLDGGIQEILGLILGEERGQPLRQLGASDLAGGVQFDHPAAGEVLEAAPHAGELAGHGGTGELALVEGCEPAADGAGICAREASQLLAREEGFELGEISGVASKGVARDPPLVIEIAEELADGILHPAALTRRRARPLPGSRTRRARTGASVCRPWPPARSGRARHTSGTARRPGGPRPRTYSRDTGCTRRRSCRAGFAAPRADLRSQAPGTRCRG